MVYRSTPLQLHLQHSYQSFSTSVSRAFTASLMKVPMSHVPVSLYRSATKQETENLNSVPSKKRDIRSLTLQAPSFSILYPFFPLVPDSSIYQSLYSLYPFLTSSHPTPNETPLPLPHPEVEAIVIAIPYHAICHAMPCIPSLFFCLCK